MKFLVSLSVFLFSSFIIHAQVKEVDDKFQFQRVYRNDNENLEARIDHWLELNFSELNERSAKGEFKTNWMKKNGTISYQIAIETKPGRYRVTVTDFAYQQSEDTGTIPFESSIFKKQLVTKAETHLYELTNSLINSINSNGEEW